MLFRVPVICATGMMLLAACAPNRPSSSAAECLPVTAGVGEAQPRVTVSARDDRFEPACINAPGEGEITLLVRNEGRHPHNLTLADGDSVSVDSAQVAFLTARVGREGLSYVCTIHPGMRGHITVRP